MVYSSFLQKTFAALYTFFVYEYDARPMLCAFLGIGLLVWHLSFVALGIATGVIWIFVPAFALYKQQVKQGIRFAVLFSLLWGIFLLVIELVVSSVMYYSSPLQASFWQQLWNAFSVYGWKAMELSLRMLLLTGIGLLLLGMSNPRHSALALGWFLRPILGQNTWKVALSGALFIHALPLFLSMAGQLHQQVQLRLAKTPVFYRFRLWCGAFFRLVGQSTHKQAMALMARKLDTEKAWVLQGLPKVHSYLVPSLFFAFFLLLWSAVR